MSQRRLPCVEGVTGAPAVFLIGTQKQLIFRDGVLTPGSFAASAAPAATASTTAARTRSFTARFCAARRGASRGAAKPLHRRHASMNLAREAGDLLGQPRVLLEQLLLLISEL